MSDEPKIDDVLNFLDKWKSGIEIRNRFNLTQNEFAHLSKWLVKGKFVTCCGGGDINKSVDGRIVFYKRIVINTDDSPKLV